jgi:hypothetical protein
MRLLIVACLCLVLTGCGIFVPHAIKREVTLSRIDLQNVNSDIQLLLNEAAIKTAEGDELTKTKQFEEAEIKYKEAVELLRQATEKSNRSYKRVNESLINIENYMYRKH